MVLNLIKTTQRLVWGGLYLGTGLPAPSWVIYNTIKNEPEGREGHSFAHRQTTQSMSDASFCFPSCQLILKLALGGNPDGRVYSYMFIVLWIGRALGDRVLHLKIQGRCEKESSFLEAILLES